MLRIVTKYFMKCPTSLCEAMVVLSLYKKTQIGYTQYVDNDVYVDDVGDDEAGAGAYFFPQIQRCPPSTLKYIECQAQAFLYV